jgi:hypothetical protein
MGKTRRTKKFAEKKRILNPNDTRIKKNIEKFKEKEQKIQKAIKNKVHEDLEVKEL